MDHILLSTEVVMLPSQHLVKQPHGCYPMVQLVGCNVLLDIWLPFFSLWLLLVVVCACACIIQV